MASLLDHHRELLEKCGLSTGGLNSSDIDHALYEIGRI